MAGHVKKLAVLSVLVCAVFGASLTFAGEPEARLKAFRKDLARKGFVVQDGILDFPEILGMCCACKLPSCFANNPSSPYGLAVLPPAPDQSPSVPNPYSEWFTENHTYPDGFSWFWRLRPDEAVVFIGTTPPRMKYFGFTAYLYDRYHPLPQPPPACQADTFVRPAPLSSYNRIPLFASLGDTVNHMTVRTSGDAPNPFGRNVVFILAADKNIEARVRRALLDAGYPKSILNTIVIPPDIARLGVESVSDTLTFVLRMATDQNLDDYKKAPRALLRISPSTPVPSSSLVPLETPRLRVRGIGKTETRLLPAVDALGRAIVAAYPGYDAKPIYTTNWYEGYNCIENGQNCLGDNRDTPYIPPSFNPVTARLTQEDDMILQPGEFLVAYGVNHVATKKAVYANIAVLGWNHKASPAVIDDSEMAGTAEYFLGASADPATADMLYAWKITRLDGCTGDDTPNCREIDTSCLHGVGADEPMAIVFRAYLEKKTKVGAAYGEIVIDRILKFTPKTN